MTICAIKALAFAVRRNEVLSWGDACDFSVTPISAEAGFTNLTFAPANNAHLGSEFKLDCGFTYTDAISMVRKVDFYRKTQNDTTFVEIANADSVFDPEFRWVDTALQSRSDFTMVNRTLFRITVRSLECGDRAEYRCMYFVGNRNGENTIYSNVKALEIPGKQ